MTLQEHVNNQEYTADNSVIKPSHLNKTVGRSIQEIREKNRKFLFDRNGNSGLPAMDLISFGATTVFTLGSFCAIVAAPAIMAPLLPTVAVVGMAGLVGTLVLGQYHKFKERSEVKKFANEFCAKSGLNPEYYESSFDSSSYRVELLKQIITNEHISPSMKPTEVKDVIENASKNTTESIFTKIKESIPSIDITSRIKNSAKAFIAGYQAAKEEMTNNNAPKSPKI